MNFNKKQSTLHLLVFQRQQICEIEGAGMYMWLSCDGLDNLIHYLTSFSFSIEDPPVARPTLGSIWTHLTLSIYDSSSLFQEYERVTDATLRAYS
jgi:hypothetical protein